MTDAAPDSPRIFGPIVNHAGHWLSTILGDDGTGLGTEEGNLFIAESAGG
ncbi:MAG: hypothetical protein WKG07_29505 [Hymenobacter sp.]